MDWVLFGTLLLPMDTLAFRLEQPGFHLADDMLYLQNHSHPTSDLNFSFEIVVYYYVYYSWLLLCCALALLLLHLYSFYTEGHIGPTLFSMSCVLVYTRTDPPVPLVVPLNCSSAGLCNCIAIDPYALSPLMKSHSAQYSDQNETSCKQTKRWQLSGLVWEILSHLRVYDS